jgi:carbonic anhydrase
MHSRWPLVLCLPSVVALAATDPYAPPDFGPKPTVVARTPVKPRLETSSRPKTTRPTERTKPAEPTEPAKSVEVVKPAEPVKPVEAVKPAEPVKSVEAPKPVAPPKPDADQIISGLTSGNERFVQGALQQRDLLAARKAQADGSKPNAIVLGCSDSRVPPELVFDQPFGELFVVRSFGTVADSASLASLEYATEHLEASVLVVLGHEKCSAISAAASGVPMASPHLHALVEEISPGIAPLRPKYAGGALVHYGVEANVKATSYEVIERSPILRKRVEAGTLRVVRAVYDVDSGKVRWLE